MLKKSQVVMLPTNEKASNIHIDFQERMSYVPTGKLIKTPGSYQHLYFLSDEEIKEGDWYYTSLEHDNPWISQCKEVDKSREYWLDRELKYQGSLSVIYGSYKIIAATDSSLTILEIPTGFKSGVGAISHSKQVTLPQPSQSFLEVFVREYNKGNVIEEVMVEYLLDSYKENGKTYHYSDNRMTLRLNPRDNTITIKPIKDSWTREEVIVLLRKTWGYKNESIQTIDEWIEQNL